MSVLDSNIIANGKSVHIIWPVIGASSDVHQTVASRRADVGLSIAPVGNQNHETNVANMISATEALDRLRAGNKRFASDLATRELRTRSEHRNALIAGQEPFAIILGCSDSRVPAEIVFDQGLGDLFVIRVAGNIVAPSQIGSIEFAAEQFGAKLVVVLGHSNCGAVSATLEQLGRTVESRSPNLRAIVDRVRPSIEELMSREPQLAGDDLARESVRANICASVERLQHGSQILEDLVADGDLLIVGAEYSLETGLVNFFDNMPKETSPMPAATPSPLE